MKAPLLFLLLTLLPQTTPFTFLPSPPSLLSPPLARPATQTTLKAVELIDHHALNEISGVVVAAADAAVKEGSSGNGESLILLFFGFHLFYFKI